jgi:hypothetical protein
MLTSHILLQQYWHDDRHEISKVRVWYTDRGASNDRSSVDGPDINLEPYYISIRTLEDYRPWALPWELPDLPRAGDLKWRRG